MAGPAGKVTLEDVAAEAGVSLATADRVVNKRPGVRDKTAARVNEAVLKLGYRPDIAAARLARNRSFRFAFILPVGDNTFMTQLTEQVGVTAAWLAGQRAFIDTLHVDVFDPDVIGRTLERLPRYYDGVAVVALDHPRVRAAIDDLTARGTTVVTLVSDVPSSRRFHYVGIDNPAAGRTAGTLMGRFPRRQERQDRYRRRLARVARPRRTLFRIQPGDRRRVSEARNPRPRGRPRRTRALGSGRPSACSPSIPIWSASIAWGRAIAASLRRSTRPGAKRRIILWIAHELTAYTRRFLLLGTLDAVIGQNAGHEARSAGRVLLAQCSGERIVPDQETIGIDIFVRGNIPAEPAFAAPIEAAPRGAGRALGKPDIQAIGRDFAGGQNARARALRHVAIGAVLFGQALPRLDAKIGGARLGPDAELWAIGERDVDSRLAFDAEPHATRIQRLEMEGAFDEHIVLRLETAPDFDRRVETLLGAASPSFGSARRTCAVSSFLEQADIFARASRDRSGQIKAG